MKCWAGYVFSVDAFLHWEFWGIVAMSSKPAWATYTFSGWAGLPSETLSQTPFIEGF